MPFQVIPRELAFFDLFDRQADGIVRGAIDLTAMLRAGSAISSTTGTT